MKRHLFFVVTLAFLFYSCYKYPEGSTVTLVVNHKCKNTKSVDVFTSSIKKWLLTVSKENGDFQVIDETEDSKDSVQAKATHIITIDIDSVILIEMKEYKEVLNKVDSISEKYSKAVKFIPSIFLNGIPIAPNPLSGGSFREISLESAPCPSMKILVTIKELSTDTVVWDYDEKIESISTVAISTDEQFAELLSTLRNELDEKVAFLKLK